MHQRLDTDDSLLEADGLADFAARLRDSLSSRGGAGRSSTTFKGSWGEQGGRWNHGDEHDPPHSQPARYHPPDLLPSSSLATFTPPQLSTSPTRPNNLSDSILCAQPSPAHSFSVARPSPPRPGSFGPQSTLARPLLKRESGPGLVDVHHDTTLSSSSYGPALSLPASALPYPPPPPFVSPASADPHAVAYPFDDYDDYRIDMCGDLGTSSRSARPDSVGNEGDAAYEKDFAASPGRSVGEWHAPGGAYLHGVGFDDSHAHGAAQPPRKSAAALERRREQLARKFGGSAAQPAGASARSGGARTEEEEVTGVDAQGRLVTLGRRKRIFLRCAQASCAVLVGVCAIGAALTKPVETADQPAPAPKGSAPHWALIVLPFLSLALTTYTFAIYPYLHRRRRASEAPAHGPGGASAGALGVYPVVQPPQQYPNSKRSWFGSGRGRVRGGPGPGGKYGAPNGGMSVNLIIDPRLLPGLGGAHEPQRSSDVERRERQQKKRRRKRRRRRDERRRAAAAADDGGAALFSSPSSSSLSTLSSDDSDPWTASRSSGTARDGTLGNPRTALLSHLQHDAAWRIARSFARRVAAADFVCCIAWGAVSVWAIGWAGKCAPGDGEGFCSLFNSAEACAVLASIAFASSFALGCFDISRAKLSPRMRQQRLAVSA